MSRGEPDTEWPRFVQMAALIYPGVAALDVVGPCAVLAQLPGVSIQLVGECAGPVATDTGEAHLSATHLLSAVTAPDILLVPGGWGAEKLLDRPEILGWLRDVHLSASWTLTVGSGSLLLAAAGLLTGVPATTYTRDLGRLAKLGAIPRAVPIVEHGDVATAAGALPAVNMAIAFASRRLGANAARSIRDGLTWGDARPALRLVQDASPPSES